MRVRVAILERVAWCLWLLGGRDARESRLAYWGHELVGLADRIKRQGEEE